jgi:hypothetical protein
MANKSALPNITSTYVVLDTEGKAMPIAVSETFWQELARTFGDFAGRRLVSCFNFDKIGRRGRFIRMATSLCVSSREMSILFWRRRVRIAPYGSITR